MPAKKRNKKKLPVYKANGHLKSTKDMVAYLETCIERGGDDPVFIAAALGNIARTYGMVKLARQTGLTRGGLYKTLSPDGNPSLGTVLKVMKALGVKLTPEVA